MFVAFVALFVALGGASYAAFSLPRNSVGTPQIKRGAVTLAKISSGAQTALKGRKGDPGPQGIQGSQGIQGVPGPITGVLPSDVTLRGTYDAHDTATAAGEETRTDISFGLALPSAPTVNFIAVGAAVPAGCTGGTAATPTAAPGNLCIYEAAFVNSTTRGEFDVITGIDNTAERFGFVGFANSDAAGFYGSRGSWAVTAP